MTPNKQVSPVIRISQGERDASARATHLEAATRKFLVTTNERKYMSTKTNFKRIALVAVAALGLGVLSSVPSQAMPANITITATGGTATTATSDTTTGGAVSVSALMPDNLIDSLSVSVVLKSAPAGYNVGVYPKLVYIETTTPGADTTRVSKVGINANGAAAITDSATATFPMWLATTTDNGYVGAKFIAVLDTKTNSAGQAVGVPLKAGTYVLTVVAQPYATNASDVAKTVGTASYQDISIVVSGVDAESTAASPVYSTAWLNSSTSTDSTRDSTVAVAATGGTTTVATIRVTLKNASDLAVAQESITVTTDKGLVGNGTAGYGRSLVLVASAGVNDILVRADGTAGVATITVSTPSVTFTAKKINFFSTTVTKITGTKLLNTLGVGSNTAVILGTASDAAGVVSASSTAVYAYSSDTAVVSNFGTACAYNADYEGQVCALTGVTAGTAKITLRNKSTVALSTVTSTDVIEVTVSTSTPASIKLAFDKATYAPGEKAYILISVLDSAGKSVPTQTAQNFLSSTGITSNVAFGNGSTADTTLDDASIAVAQRNVSAPLSTEPIMAYTVFMPASGGTVTISATGGSALPVAGQVKVTASATVTDSGAAALAAVNALATTVASLRTLITTLTNLVLKIQKKVKA
jgi:hypothetical protein